MFHASNVDLQVGDYLLPSKYNGRVYATKEKHQCLIFGRNNDSLRDLGSIVGSFPLENGELGITYTEHFPYIFEEEFRGKSAFIYEVEDTGFVQGGWRVEYYKTEKVKIVKKYRVRDLYEEIIKFAKQGKYKINFYEETKAHIDMVVNHLLMQIANKCCKVEDVIKIASEHNAQAVEEYFKGLQKLNSSILEVLPEKASNVQV